MKLMPPVIVFVRPQAPGNLGALARVMSNFECTELRYTGALPVQDSHPSGFSTMDWAMARKGQKILEEARLCSSLEEALNDVQLAVGSSGRDNEFEGGYGRPQCTPQEAFATVAEWMKDAHSPQEPFRWAFVLGPEDDGLNQQESSLCQKLVKLPTVDSAPSMNIAMAAGCFLYHWHLGNLGWATHSQSPDSGPFPLGKSHKPAFSETGRSEHATEYHKQRFLDYLMATLERTSFLKYPDVESVKARIRRWLQLAPIPLGELLFAFEILYHLRAWGSGSFEKRDFLGKNENPPS